MKLNRREWNKLAVSGLAAAACSVTSPAHQKRPRSKFRGVQIGVQTYSFLDRSLDEAIKAMVEVGLSSCELWSGHLEPHDLLEKYKQTPDEQTREEIRRWRLSVPLDQFRAARAKFDRAGIALHAYNLSFRDDFTDAEIERGFEMARALGAQVMTSSSTVSVVKRLDPFARRYRMKVGMHNHSDLSDPNEFATPESFERALKGASEYIAINLDIGHFTAANFDAVEFLRTHHRRIVALHIKDRKRDQGPNVPFGQGDTPIKRVLTLLRLNRWPIPANIEYEYEGQDTVAEVRKCLAYCRRALGA